MVCLMGHARFFSGRFAAGLLLVLAGTFVLPFNMRGQTTPATTQAGTAAESQLPAEIQAQLDKLQEALKAAQGAGAAKAEAKALNQIGEVYFRTSQFQKALDDYNQALMAARSAKDTQQEAAALNGLGGCYRQQGQNQKALDTYQQALDLATSSGNELGEATALNGMGWVNENAGQLQEAMEFQNRALPLAQKAKDRSLEATILRRIGYVYSGQGKQQKAIDTLQQALSIFRQTGDRDGEARTLFGIGIVYDDLGEKQKALDYYNRALPIARQVGDRNAEAMTLIYISDVYSALGERQKALEYLAQALRNQRQAGDRPGEASTLEAIGDVYAALGEYRKALDHYSQALPIARQLGDRHSEAAILGGLGFVYFVLWERQKALEYHNLALTLFRDTGDRGNEAWTLNCMGNVYAALGENQKALEYFNQALPLWRALGDRSYEASSLNDIAIVYSSLGEKQKALENFSQALPIFHQEGERRAEARALANLGEVYQALGEKQKALEYYTQALAISREAGDRDCEATTLTDTGDAYSGLGQHQKALEYYSQALTIQREIGHRGGEGTTLTEIGDTYSALGERQKALESYNQALPILREVGDRSGEADALNSVGETYNALGEKQKALDYMNHALQLATAVSDPLLEASIFNDLMLNQKAPQPTLAIFYGKQAVNLLQQVRGNIKGLGKELQKSFLASKEDYYHDLADLLIAQGRLPEAQQVLGLLKQQEYSDYVRGETANMLSPLTLTPAEKEAEEDYQKSTAQLVALGEQWAELKKITARTAEQEKQYQQLSDQLDAASKGLNDYYARLYLLFGKNSEANKQVADVKGDVSLLKQTIARMPHTVALYTLVGKDRISVIVISGTTTVAREYAIPEADLNKKVAEFEQALRDPAKDPKPPAQELYKILIGPVKADLDQAEAQTLVWSLDGVLRYVPMAALYDGKQYVVEKYNTVTITPASIAHLAEKPDVSSLSAAAMGISRKYEEGLTALPAVVGELDGVVKDAQVQGANGVLPGTILLNGQFTEKAMESQLGGQHAVMHIASHFVFKPGDDSQSYLLLAGRDEGGQGFHLTVADFRDNQKLALDDTDLLTLSACETGMSGNASNGREVDGLGTTAQLKGAKAVISSLWEVDDASTGELMGDFYKRWAEGGGKVTKVEALREAQLDLLLGKVKPLAGASGRGMGRAKPVHEVAAGYAHPYYWAPFVLMGNWR